MTNPNPILSEVWATLSRKILASILIDPGACIAVHDIVGQRRDWFSIKERPIYDAVLQCLASDTPPTLEAVKARLNGTAEPGYLTVIASLFNEDDNRLLIYNTQQLRDIGILAKIRALGRELSGMEDIDNINEIVAKQANELTGLVADRSMRDSSANKTSESAWAMVDLFDGQGIPTGLNWFDNLTGGIWPGMNYWIGGAYKSGKTTVMRNCVLAEAQAGYPVGVMCLEGTRELFTLDCQAMLATAILSDQGKTIAELKRVDGLSVLRHYRRNGYFTGQELDAIHKAKAEWAKLPINIWDMKDGIDDTSSLAYFVRKAKLNYGTRVFWADHSQLFGKKGTTYEKQSEISRAVQKIATNEDIAFGVLSQQNEEGVSGGQNYSPKIKGGGDAPAAADALLLPSLDDDTSILTITLKLSRHTRKGGKGYHYIAPSGLIMDKWGCVDVTQMVE